MAATVTNSFTNPVCLNCKKSNIPLEACEKCKKVFFCSLECAKKFHPCKAEEKAPQRKLSIILIAPDGNAKQI